MKYITKAHTVILLLTVLSNLVFVSEAMSDTQFIRYKGQIIPIAQRPVINAPSLTATEDAANSVFLVWSQPLGASSFKLQRMDEETIGWQTIYSGADITYTDIHAPSGTVIYRVRPCNAQGCSRSSRQATLSLPEQNSGGGWTFEDDPVTPPDPDLDSDGVLNESDFCPNTPANEPVNMFGCSVAQSGGQVGGSGLTFQCIDPNSGAASDDPNCPDAQRDSDFDYIVDSADPYPLQANGFCPAN